MSKVERTELFILASILLPALAVGLLLNHSLLSLLLGALVYLAWHLYHLRGLCALIRQHRYIHSPYPPGLWGEIYQGLEQARINGRKHKSELLRFTSRFRKATGAIPDGLVLLDQNQRIEWANPAASTLLNIGFPAHEGKSILDLLRFPFLHEYLSAADFIHPLEFPSPNHSGMVISLQIIPYGNDKHSGLILMVRDITQIFNLNQIRKDFVANVSHELKTPLTVLAGFIEVLGDSAKLPTQERPLQLMQQQSKRMQLTIDDLLSLSQLEMAQDTRIPQLVSVPALLAELISDAQDLSGDQRHKFSWEIDPDLGLLGNEAELRGIFSNLIFNAVKHTPPRAEIRIYWKFQKQKASFIIVDSGEGIAARHLPRLTERFYRVDQSRSRESGGTGLGLAIVKHGISRHGGELDIQSKVGMGSTFHCSFPDGVFCLLRTRSSTPAPSDL